MRLWFLLTVVAAFSITGRSLVADTAQEFPEDTVVGAAVNSFDSYASAARETNDPKWTDTGIFIVSGFSMLLSIATVILLWRYTSETQKLARTAVSAERRARQELSIRLRPVISITANAVSPQLTSTSPNEHCDFYPIIKNLSDVHATLIIKTQVYFGGRWREFPSTNYYGGKPWTLQANETFEGHCDWTTGVDLTLENYKTLMDGAMIRLQSWTVNLFDKTGGAIEVDENANPQLFWSWNARDEYWMPEPKDHD